jgi:hypothetical protein
VVVFMRVYSSSMLDWAIIVSFITLAPGPPARTRAASMSKPTRSGPRVRPRPSRCVGAEVPEIVCADAHRWRCAQPGPGLGVPCLFEDDRPIGVAGDWCGGGRIESAFSSGLALAGRVLGRVAESAGVGSGAGATSMRVGSGAGEGEDPDAA